MTRRGAAARRILKEQSKRTSFLKWIHADGLWMPAQSGGGTYGLIGMHIAMVQMGRVYVFGPPGIMLVMQETSRGRMFRPGFTWGVSYRLTDVWLPGKTEPVELFLNMTRCWTTGSYSNGISMVGFSLTWTK